MPGRVAWPYVILAVAVLAVIVFIGLRALRFIRSLERSASLERATQERARFVLVIDWRDPSDPPLLELRGELWPGWPDEAQLPYALTAEPKTIDHSEYAGVQNYYGDGADEHAPESLVLEAYAHRVHSPLNGIDIRVSSKESFLVEVMNFEDGVVRFADTKDVVPDLPTLYSFPPGDYHLEAVLNAPFPRSMAPGGREIPLVVGIDWDERHDIAHGEPSWSVSGGYCISGTDRPDVPGVHTSSEREINGFIYEGPAYYRGAGAERCDPSALVLEMPVRRLYVPTQILDIHVTCRAEMLLRFESFRGGVLRDAETQRLLAPPYLLEPGDYHLEATVPEKPDAH